MSITDNELLLALSRLLDVKLHSELCPIKNDLQAVKSESRLTQKDVQMMKGELQATKDEVHQIKLYQENMILPRLETMESCYLDTYNRYKNYADKMDGVFVDVGVLKKVVTEHSEKLQEIS